MKFNDPNARVWVTGCPHVFHDPSWNIPLWKMRGFNSEGECTRFFFDSANKHVGQDDVLFILGDYALNASYETVDGSFDRMNCKNIFYIWGNHESSTKTIFYNEVGKAYPFLPPKTAVYPFKYKNITFLGSYAEVVIKKKFCVLSHYPFLIWNRSHHKSINLCSHSHGSCPYSNLSDTRFGRVIDVGFERCMDVTNRERPFLEFGEVLDLLSKVDPAKVDHHDENTN